MDAFAHAAVLVVGIVIVALSLTISSLAVKRAFHLRFPWEHKHDFDVRGIHQLTMYTGNDTSGLPTSRHTKVLWACRDCSAREVRKLDGHWSLEEVQRRRTAKGIESPWQSGLETK